MMRIFTIAAALLLFTAPSFSQKADPCAAFQALVKKTYNFDVARMTTAQKRVKEKEMDRFWTTVKARREYWPCLREAVENPKSGAFFRFDGSNLLTEVQPSLASKALQVQVYTATKMDIVGQERWVNILARRGAEGFDIGHAALRWLSEPDAEYEMRDHFGFRINRFMAALFLFGSMNEEKATPALIKVVTDKKHPQRETAVAILMDQGTPAALQALRNLDLEGLDPRIQQNVEGFLTAPRVLEPRDKPLLTREQYLKAFESQLKGDIKPFMALVEKVPDGEHDAVAVLKAEDLPLLRRVRRDFIASCNPHSIDYYNDFTDIILTIVFKEKLAPLPVAQNGAQVMWNGWAAL